MRLRMMFAVLMFAALWTVAGAVRAEEKLEAVDALPEGLSKEVAAVLDAKGQRVIGDKGPVCSIWLVKEVPTKVDFKPTLSVKYPLVPGELIGVLQVEMKKKFTDFRGQEIKPGVYTLRYSLQPVNGDHLGASPQRDFLVLVPAADDKDANAAPNFETLMGMSRKASGTPHPAVLSIWGAGAGDPVFGRWGGRGTDEANAGP